MNENAFMFTLNNNKIVIQEKLIKVSHNLVWWMFCNTFVKVSKVPCEEIFNPKRPFNWETTIIMDVAEVKPTVTGIEIKSISTPVKEFCNFK